MAIAYVRIAVYTVLREASLPATRERNGATRHIGGMTRERDGATRDRGGVTGERGHPATVTKPTVSLA